MSFGDDQEIDFANDGSEREAFSLWCQRYNAGHEHWQFAETSDTGRHCFAAWQARASALYAAPPSPAPQGERAQGADDHNRLAEVARVFYQGELTQTADGQFWTTRLVPPAPQTTEPAPEAGVVEALLDAIKAEDIARDAWDDCGCGHPEFEHWMKAIERRKQASAAVRAALAAQTANLRGTE